MSQVAHAGLAEKASQMSVEDKVTILLKSKQIGHFEGLF